jgi:hypothetical protein
MERPRHDPALRLPALGMALWLAIALGPGRCASSSEREKSLLLRPVSAGDSRTYEGLLVLPEQYTSNGALYHARYRPCLIAIARAVTEEGRLTVEPRSVGFYFDKKENVKNRLYLGLDVVVPADRVRQGVSFESAAVSMLNEYLRSLLTVIHSCTSVFSEEEVVGTVIGFRWEGATRTESMNIWIDKKDVSRFENMRLTLKELISRSMVTNTEGKLIRLLL